MLKISLLSYFTYYNYTVLTIYSLDKIISSHFYYIRENLLYITIIALFNYQLSIYFKYIKANI